MIILISFTYLTFGFLLALSKINLLRLLADKEVYLLEKQDPSLLIRSELYMDVHRVALHINVLIFALIWPYAITMKEKDVKR